MKIEYVDHMGSDLTVVNSARVSFDKRSEWETTCTDGSDCICLGRNTDICACAVNILSDKDKKLIKYLARHDHFTPFTHCMITLRETVPIFVARQRFKHQIGFSNNEVSRRYDDSPPEFYYPQQWRKRADNIKQGSSDEEITHINWNDDKVALDHIYDEAISFCNDLYLAMIDQGVAPEQARMVLPQSMHTSYYITGSLSAFARAYNLRSDGHAQKEIQYLAKQWDKIIRPLYPNSWSALVDFPEYSQTAET